MIITNSAKTLNSEKEKKKNLHPSLKEDKYAPKDSNPSQLTDSLCLTVSVCLSVCLIEDFQRENVEQI